MKIITLKQIKEVLPSLDLISTIEEGFVAYSNKQAVVPPVGELLLAKGEVHIKYGYIKNDDYYVIKIASGFYENPQIGLSSSNGLMLLFSQQTGELLCILLDEGYLTDVRTAIAGAIAAKYMAPKDVVQIGIVGAGIQASLQLEYLAQITTCRNVLVWGITELELTQYKDKMEQQNFSIKTTLNANDILDNCNLIVTATPAKEPILKETNLQSGTHITAIGSDTPHKQELESAILNKADIVIADSISQCMARGEIYKAIQANEISKDKIVELGNIINGQISGRTNDTQITVADLTGVAVQDINIAKAVYNSYQN